VITGVGRRCAIALSAVLSAIVGMRGTWRVRNIGQGHMPSNANPQRLAFIDGLRFIAAASVLVQHIFEHTAVVAVFYYFASGIFGVVLFFFVSGFIIPHSLRKGFDPDSFVINRIFRIFPTYLVVLGVLLVLGTLGIQPWAAQAQGLGAVALLANLLLVPEYVGAPQLLGVAWTLPLEFAWYGVCALVFVAGGKRWAFATSLAYSLVVLFLAIGSLSLGLRLPLGRLGLINAALLGFICYLWFTQQLATKQLRGATLAFVVSMAIAVWVSFGYFQHPTTDAWNAALAWGAALAVFMGALAIPSVQSSYLLTGKWPKYFGRISYSIYLSHPIFIDLLLPTGNTLTLIVGSTALTLLCSGLMFTYVELPGVALGRRVVGWLQLRKISVLSDFRNAERLCPRPRPSGNSAGALDTPKQNRREVRETQTHQPARRPE
jgi:peptidoglycan/LPS O-acetylase OafA/YrhL